jgi:hypothetical protein
MAKTSIAIYKKIDQLTKKQQVRKDLPFLLSHYSALKLLGVKDDLIVDLFNQGLLELALKDILDEIKNERELCQ